MIEFLDIRKEIIYGYLEKYGKNINTKMNTKDKVYQISYNNLYFYIIMINF